MIRESVGVSTALGCFRICLGIDWSRFMLLVVWQLSVCLLTFHIPLPRVSHGSGVGHWCTLLGIGLVFCGWKEIAFSVFA